MSCFFNKSVLIAGYKIKHIDFDHRKEFYKELSQINNASEESCPKFIQTDRDSDGHEYDYNEFGDDETNIYIAWKYYVLPMVGILDREKLLKVLNCIHCPLPTKFGDFVEKHNIEISEFDIHLDICNINSKIKIL